MSKHNRDRRKRNRERRKAGLSKYADEVVATGLAALAHGTMKRGEAYVINVAHDDWCDLLSNSGPCNCNPTVGKPERVPKPEEN